MCSHVTCVLLGGSIVHYLFISRPQRSGSFASVTLNALFRGRMRGYWALFPRSWGWSVMRSSMCMFVTYVVVSHCPSVSLSREMSNRGAWIRKIRLSDVQPPPLLLDKCCFYYSDFVFSYKANVLDGRTDGGGLMVSKDQWYASLHETTSTSISFSCQK